MRKRLKIGIVGCGAIGSSLAKAVAEDFKKDSELVALFDIDSKKAKDLSGAVSKSGNLSVSDTSSLISKSELVIEAASAKVSWDIAKKALSGGRSVMIMSVGGVISHLKDMTALARKSNAKVYIPSGAISGIDALKAAKIKKVKSVILTTRKHPMSFKGVEYLKKKKIDLERIKKDKVLFFGKAKDAVKYFPQNINVAAVLSLAGVGQDKTFVRIIASLSAKRNIHEVSIESEAANISTRTENTLHPDNPKTSFLAVLSAIAVLKRILEPVKVGS
ncbi:MAG: DUF108 domain-containing protein [Candidatus Omnitrophica bacterium]|nr:DUF108 domain-containing protein [Candidatus Omnitrophota bacterium]MBU1869391.1 DUF108 domain-containing protein [Candidatus Omnitrophota bacterium]